MRIFLAGATGVLGRRLVPRLVGRGHEVTGLTRSPQKAGALRATGAEVAVADALDEAAVRRAVADASPEVVVHQLTALSKLRDLRRFAQEFAPTNELRTRGTDILLAAARDAGARRFVAQSYAGWPFARTGGPVKTEDDPLDPEPPAAFRAAFAAIRHLEDAVTGADLEGIVLRYGSFYGPGTTLGAGGAHLDTIARGRMPVVGSGGGIWSFIHIDDAADATVAAIERGAPGIYHIVDDEPAPVAEWVPALAAAIGAPTPKRVPAWVARPLIGAHGVVMMTEIRGASNEKAKRELDWEPRFRTWRDGFRTGMGFDAEAEAIR